MASNAERSAHLLSLLKFSTQNSAAAASAQQQQQYGPIPPPHQYQNPHPHPHPHPHPSQVLQQQHHNLQHHHSVGQYHGQHGYQPSSLSHQYQAGDHGAGHDSEIDPPIDIPAPRIHQPAPVPADPTGLLAALMRGARDVEDPKLKGEPDAPAQAPPASNFSTSFSTASPGPGPDTRTYLLNLLNRPKPSQNDAPLPGPANASPSHTPPSHHGISQAPPQAHNQHADPAPYYEYQRGFQESAQSGYSYGSGSQKSLPVNAPEPSDYTSVGQPGSVRASPNQPTTSYQILKKSHSPGRISSPLAREVPISPISKPGSPALDRPESRSTVANSPEPSHHFVEKETVAEAVKELADQADREADEALERAEKESIDENEIADNLEDMLAAESQRELEESTQATAQAIQKELDREENEDLLEAVLKPEVARQVRELVNEAAVGVADSWESADQEDYDASKDEEPPFPVRVFEFPMRPWISITLVADATEPRPLFSDRAVMDVAKLKKDFDQVDRNLYTASERYMAYGMSKAGGIRVIRQDDGRDIKVFTDTNDRVFNVAMPVTPPDHGAGTHKEAVIGTGVSGTVYWVEITDGDKDHLKDAHLEQYGFALPPITAQDGDTPSVMLKTRARISSAHPEFFAVARGKWINVVWPSFILKNKLFQPGHDRVVDTELLSSKCSLKINTGKAGKDFAFSQDDSVIISLDKSGRVKFWDVRDLTAAEDSAARSPMPAHTSMEITEPIITLSTTPEGEKAWPTSVLLLDKQKPYQRRSALRYLIVGMKQNHTIQLWDLALGKPVQEFNLPHSKEADAVCSVMYHPGTGMIVIGHPTRNSIYFAHLSAPKYNLRPLSQAEYMQKLALGDDTLPTPDSTAVISGVREYSFANRGTLRSLDILCTPAVNQDGYEPTLFELYAMHSKGVACLLIKHSDLGWSKDNKVVAPVNALDVGAITIEKVRALPQEPAAVPEEAQSHLPIRIAARTTPRESAQSQQAARSEHSPVPVVRRVPEASTTPGRNRDRDSETSQPGTNANANASANADRADKKQRNKKKPNGPESASNGVGPSPRIAPMSAAKQPEPMKPAASMIQPQMVQEAIEPLLSSLESRMGAHLIEAFSHSLGNLHGQIEQGLQTRDSDFNERQRRLLDMVSEVLNENTQKVLQSIIHDQFLHSVIPAITNIAGKAVNEQIGPKLTHIANSVRDEIHSNVPTAVAHAVQNSELSQKIADRVGKTLSTKLADDIIPHLSQVFTGVTVSACQHVLEQSQQQTREQLEAVKAAHRLDSQKIEQLSGAVARLTETVVAMANSQAQFQDRLMRIQSQTIPQGQPPPVASHDRPTSNSLVLRENERFDRGSQRSQHSEYDYPTQSHQSIRSLQQFSPQAGPDGVTSPSHSSTQAALSRANAYIARQANTHGATRSDHPTDQVKAYFDSQQYEKALLAWIQSGNEDHMFDNLIYSYNPAFMDQFDLPPLVLMSIATTVSQNFTGTHVAERVAWMDTTLQSLQRVLLRGTNDEQVSRVMPKVMGLVADRIEKLFKEVNLRSPMDPALASLSRMIATTATIVEVNGRALANGNRASYSG